MYYCSCRSFQSFVQRHKYGQLSSVRHRLTISCVGFESIIHECTACFLSCTDAAMVNKEYS